MNTKPSWRLQAFRLLAAGDFSSRATRVVNQVLIWLIVANVAAVTIVSSVALSGPWTAAFFGFEIMSVVIFSIEYVLRVWTCVENPVYRGLGPWRARFKYMHSPLAIVDFLAVAPFYLSMFISFDLRYLRLFRLIRLLKLSHFLRSLEIFGMVLRSEAKALAAAVFIMFVLVFIAASLMFSIENTAQPEAFGSVFQSIWWAVVTMTTVGYGDVAPVTGLGKLIGILIMLLGVGTVALPAGMLAARFSEELQARKDRLTASVLQALSDGRVGAGEQHQLDILRQKLNVSDDVLSQIVELEKTRRARASTCPHCGKNLLE